MNDSVPEVGRRWVRECSDEDLMAALTERQRARRHEGKLSEAELREANDRQRAAIFGRRVEESDFDALDDAVFGQVKG